MFSIRNISLSRARISRTKALALAGALAFTGAVVATGIGATSGATTKNQQVSADAAHSAALTAQQNPVTDAAKKLVADRAAALAKTNRSDQRAAVPAAVPAAAPVPDAATIKAAADKAAADAAAKAAATKAAADRAAADKAAKAAADAAAIRAAAAKTAAAKAAATPSYGNNLDGWIKQAQSVLSAHGYSVSYHAIYETAMNESSGNPSATNGWDSNAAAGIPSIGLMQTIQPTFNAYALPGHYNIYNPVDNIIAGARYAAAVYGSLDNVVAARCGGSCWYGY